MDLSKLKKVAFYLKLVIGRLVLDALFHESNALVLSISSKWLFYRQANGFLGTSHEDLAFAQGGGAPAFSGDQFFTGQFLIMTGTGFDHAQFSLVGEGEEVLARKDDIAGAIPILTPLHHASL